MKWYLKLFKTPGHGLAYFVLLSVLIVALINSCYECEIGWKMGLNVFAGIGILAWVAGLAWLSIRQDWKNKREDR